jgi:hypothetical protein
MKLIYVGELVSAILAEIRKGNPEEELNTPQSLKSSIVIVMESYKAISR